MINWKPLWAVLLGLGIGFCNVRGTHAIEWANLYWVQGPDVSIPHAGLRDSSDGSYVLVGETYYLSAQPRPAEGLWVLKVFPTGMIQWSKVYGAKGDAATALVEPCSRGYLIAGRKVSSQTGREDAWVLKLDPQGSVEWQKTYGDPTGSYSFLPKAITLTHDCGYVIVGERREVATGEKDGWVMRLDQNGNLLWHRGYGGVNKSDWFNAVQVTSDGKFIVAGRTCSFGMASPWAGDGWVLKLDSDGNVEWERTYGGPYEDEITSLIITADGYLAAGQTWSAGAGGGDGWMVKLDLEGNPLWQRTFGGEENDEFRSLAHTQGGFLAAGRTCSFSYASCNAWLQKVDSQGTILWQKAFDTDVAGGWDAAVAVGDPGDGGAIVAGLSSQTDKAIQAWVLRVDEEGDIRGCPIVNSPETWSMSVDLPVQVSNSSLGYLPDLIVDPTLAVAPTEVGTGRKEACPYAKTAIVQVMKAGLGSGTVVSDPLGINCGTDCKEVFPAGTSLVLMAIPDEGSYFVGWSGAPCDQVTEPVCTALLSAGVSTVTATFDRLYTLQIQTTGSGFGTVTSDPQGISCGTDCRESYPYGQVVRLVPRPFPGSVFSGWGGDADCSDGIVVMSSNRTCIANFERTISTSGLRVIAPNGGETLISGETYQIQWSAPSTSSPFTVQYSLDGGATWQTIAKKVSGSSISWTVPPVDRQMDQCLIKVKKRGTVTKSSSFDISDAPFTIKPGF